MKITVRRSIYPGLDYSTNYYSIHFVYQNSIQSSIDLELLNRKIDKGNGEGEYNYRGGSWEKILEDLYNTGSGMNGCILINQM